MIDYCYCKQSDLKQKIPKSAISEIFHYLSFFGTTSIVYVVTPCEVLAPVVGLVSLLI